MFEDFENRSGFWKDLGSNFTINYSGDAPSFLTSGEMWSSMDGSETQTLAAWENGWVLTNNPDGTMTATPKYTSGLISKTLVRVPVGPQSPMSSPTGGVGGVQVAFTADNKTFHATTNAPAFEDGQREWEHGGYTIKQKYIAGTSESLWTIGCMATPTSCKVKATGEFETVATSNTDSTKTHEIDCPYSGTFASSLLLADMMKKADECAEEMEAWVVANPVTDSSTPLNHGMGCGAFEICFSKNACKFIVELICLSTYWLSLPKYFFLNFSSTLSLSLPLSKLILSKKFNRAL